MTAPDTKAECDHCGHKVRILADGTIGQHQYRRHGQKIRCDHSGRRYAFHMGTFRVVSRAPGGKATLWLVECRCGEAKTGPTHDDVETWHAGHVSDAYAASSAATPGAGA